MSYKISLLNKPQINKQRVPIKNKQKVVKLKFLISPKEDLDERMQTWKRIDHIINPNEVSLIEKIDVGV